MHDRDMIISQIRQRLEILFQMVEELESGGGPTPSDVYTKSQTDTLLAGKVDKVTGSSLMTSAQASKLEGIEAGAEVNVQADWEQSDDTADDFIKNKPTIPAAQVNADWNAVSGVAQILNKPTIPDLTNYYNKTETDNEIDGAIAALDVSSTSATGHYIKSIEQVDGKISAVAELVDTSPITGSTKPITSGAVYTGLASKIGPSDYATQNTGGTVKAWTTTSGDVVTLHIATQ